MAEKIQLHDFIELDYTGKLIDGTVFDTTEKKVAKEVGFNERLKVAPATICVGEKQILPGLDDQLIGKDIGQEYEIKLSPENAFGKRDIKRLKVMPMSAFKEHKMQPIPGLQIEADGELGTVSSVSGGRVIVNFNHPLAGKEVIYQIKVTRKITDAQDQIKSFLNTSLKFSEDKYTVKVENKKAEIKLAFSFPEPFTLALEKRLKELTGLEEVKFLAETKESKKAVQKEEQPAP